MSCKSVTTPMTGRTCVITGANTGIGKAAALALAKLGATVVIVCRNAEKGAVARDEIERAARDAGRAGSATLELADLSSQAEIRALATRLLHAHPVIDVLVNNAGVALHRRELTADGIERTFAVNYLAYFLLAQLLMPALSAAAEQRGDARIVNVASGAHGATRKLDFDNLQGEKRYTDFGAYALTKLADIMFTYTLARRLDGSGITVNALHPGVVATEIWRQVPILRSIAKLFMLSAEKGARTTVYLAASPDVHGVTGTYFDKCAPAKSTALSHDVELQERLWRVSEEMTAQR